MVVDVLLPSAPAAPPPPKGGVRMAPTRSAPKALVPKKKNTLANSENSPAMQHNATETKARRNGSTKRQSGRAGKQKSTADIEGSQSSPTLGANGPGGSIAPWNESEEEMLIATTEQREQWQMARKLIAANGTLKRAAPPRRPIEVQQEAVVVIQKHARGFNERQRRADYEKGNAALSIQKHARGRHIRSAQANKVMDPSEELKREEKRFKKKLQKVHDEKQTIVDATEACLEVLTSDVEALLSDVTATLEELKEQEVAAHAAFDLDRASDAIAVADMNRRRAVEVAAAQAEAASAVAARDQGADAVSSLTSAARDLTDTVTAQAKALESQRAVFEAAQEVELGKAKAKSDAQAVWAKKEASAALELALKKAARSHEEALEEALRDARIEKNTAVIDAKKEGARLAQKESKAEADIRIKDQLQAARIEAAREERERNHMLQSVRLAAAEKRAQAQLSAATENAHAWADRAQQLEEHLNAASLELANAQKRLATIGLHDLAKMRAREFAGKMVGAVQRRRNALKTWRARRRALDPRQVELDRLRMELEARQQQQFGEEQPGRSAPLPDHVLAARRPSLRDKRPRTILPGGGLKRESTQHLGMRFAASRARVAKHTPPPIDDAELQLPGNSVEQHVELPQDTAVVLAGEQPGEEAQDAEHAEDSGGDGTALPEPHVHIDS